MSFIASLVAYRRDQVWYSTSSGSAGTVVIRKNENMKSNKKIEVRDMRGYAPEDALLDVLESHGIDSVEKLASLLEPSAYAIIPVSILERRDLSANTKLVYAEMVALSRKSGAVWATNTTLADRTGISERSVQRCISDLQEDGLIEVSIDRRKDGTWRSIRVLFDTKRKESQLGGGDTADTPGVTSCHGGGTKSVTPGVPNLSPQKRESKKRESKNKGGASFFDAPPTPEESCSEPGCPNRRMRGEIDGERITRCPIHQPMNVSQFCSWYARSKSRHIRIISDFADELRVAGKAPDFRTVAQWQAWTDGAMMKHAKILAVFDDDQLGEAMKRMMTAEYLTDFNLATLVRFVRNLKK